MSGLVVLPVDEEDTLGVIPALAEACCELPRLDIPAGICDPPPIDLPAMKDSDAARLLPLFSLFSSVLERVVS